MTTRSRNPVEHPIHDALADRYSPYVWADRDVDPGDLRSLFEAARWAASSYNEQPWRYLVACRGKEEDFARMLSCLVEGNREWAEAVPVLALGLVRTTLARNDRPNGMARHDLGAASAQLTVEATSRGLAVHQMGGILPDRIREVYGVPADHEPVTALAIGYPAPPETGPETLRERDERARTRRPLADLVFAGEFGRPAPLVAGPGGSHD
jgi:nitroreductase